LARQLPSVAIKQGKSIATTGLEYAMLSAMMVSSPQGVPWGEPGGKGWERREDNSLDSYNHFIIANTQADVEKYKEEIQKRKNTPRDNDKPFKLVIILVPEETYTCTSVQGIAELYAFHARNIHDQKELWLRRRPGVCDQCLEQPLDKPMGFECTCEEVAGPWFKGPPMTYTTGNNNAAVTRTKTSSQQKRLDELKKGVWVACNRDEDDFSKFSTRAYELSRITHEPETLKRGKRKKDYNNTSIKVGQWWMVVDDYECVNEAEGFYRLKTKGLVCVVNPGDDIFLDADIQVQLPSATSSSSSSSQQDLFRIDSESHDNLQSMYQSTRTQGGGA
jgi:hypothetical protein